MCENRITETASPIPHSIVGKVADDANEPVSDPEIAEDLRIEFD